MLKIMQVVINNDYVTVYNASVTHLSAIWHYRCLQYFFAADLHVTGKNRGQPERIVGLNRK